ncbi:MAG: hypothetical protein MUC65_09775 [Pontiellaceae bacterium]|nr:hypothetical protein [Pontiellaceae bacterium]
MEQVVPLCEELRDIAGSVGWESIDIDDDKKGLRGIVLHPSSDMESVSFLFDAKGRLHSFFDLVVGWKESDLLCASVKTQFAGSAEHIWLCGLLRHIQRTYMPKLVVTDEGGFWETGDRQELQRRMDFLGRMIKEFGSALEQASMDTVIDKNDPDAIADFIQRVAENFRNGKSEE